MASASHPTNSAETQAVDGGHARLRQCRHAERRAPGTGRPCFTGVYKDPVAGPRRVRRLNVDGDGQGDLAGHGGEQRAVFVYQLDSYRYWERELGRDDFVHGQFGENFTIEGLTRRRGLHRRPLPDRQRRLRGHPAARHLLPSRHPHERPAHARRCSSHTTAPASTSGCSPKGRFRRGTRSSRSPRGLSG